MINKSYICALDIGSSKVSGCIAKITGRRINSLFFDSLPLKSIRRGSIIDSVELVGTVGKLMKNLKSKTGINIKSVYANMSGQDIVTKHSRAVIPLAERGNKVINKADINRVNEQARILGSVLEEEIIHSIPLGYNIDTKSNIINPLGLYSHRLEVDLYLVCAKQSSVQSLNRSINQAGYEMRDLFLSGFVSSSAVFENLLKEGLSIFCDIGSDVTELLIFRNGILKDLEILDLGGDDLTIQLQEELKIPFELAEDIKRSYGSIGDLSHIGEDREILVKKSNIYKPIKQKLVSELINGKAKLICSSIKEAVEKRVPLYEVDNFIAVGRSVLLEGFIEMLENTLTIPVKLGRITNNEITSLIAENKDLSGQRYLNYVTCLGIILKAIRSESDTESLLRHFEGNIVSKLINFAREIYEDYF